MMKRIGYILKSLLFLLSITLATDDTEYLILTEQLLLPAAETMAELHSELVPESQQLVTEIVTVESLNGGSPVLAGDIREYLQQKMVDSPELTYLLLLGDEIAIPPIYSGSGNSPSDDFYTSSEPLEARPQLSTGRIPSHTLEDANEIVSKLVSYCSTPIPGNWRDKIMLLADDTNKSNNNIPLEMTHVAYSNALYQTLKTNFDILTVYGTEYTPQPGTGWLIQPEMTEDALNYINSGVAMLNYIGHGSPTTLADEKIIDMDRDILQITDPVNAIWVVGTCKFGWYDGKDAMSEALLFKPDGAIAVVAAARDIPPSSNYSFLDNFFDAINAYTDGENDYRLGDLVRMVKDDGAYEDLFHLLGDPGMILPFPRKGMVIDEEATSDSLKILDVATIVLDAEYASNESYLMINGPEKNIVRGFPENNPQYFLFYKLPGDIIYQGSMSGMAEIIIPIDVQYCDTCTASISIYTDSVDEFSGRVDQLDELPIAASDSEILDFDGPQITLLHGGSDLTRSGLVFPPHQLDIQFSDESGINLMGAMGHVLRYWVDDEENDQSLIPIFEYESATTGLAQISLAGTATGVHELNIEAWDNVNNRTLETYMIRISDVDMFTVEYVLNYPNPFHEDTHFTFHLSEAAQVDIAVYTLNGIPLRKFNNVTCSSGYNSIYWDGKDEGGDILANGAYIYTISADSVSGETVETVSKLAKVN